MPNNLGVPYKGGLGSALRVGTIIGSPYTIISYSADTFHQDFSPRISGVNTTILANQPFVWTYRILPEAVAGDGAFGEPFSMYRSDLNNNKMHLNFYYINFKNFFFTLIGTEQSPNVGIRLLPLGNPLDVGFPPERAVQKNTVYNYVLYKNEQPFTSQTAYRFYINGVYIPVNVVIEPGADIYTPIGFRTGLTFNNIHFGGNYFLGNTFSQPPMYVFNNSVFKLDSGLTTNYIDNLALELHRIDNYIHLLPTAYTVNPSNAVYYFPLYLKEGRDIRDYYNPTKKFLVEMGLGNNRTSNFVSAGTANWTAGQAIQPASIYRGPYNVWKKPYPPYEPYI